MSRAALATVLLCALAGTPAAANDSSAELATGGLVLEKSADIEMRAEDLYVSAKEIRVSAHFYNASARDVMTVVAFPMPDITIEHPDEVISVPTEDRQNILGFSTKVDGKPVEMRVEQKVYSRGTERTDVLRRLGVPLAPHLAATNATLDRLAPAAQNELVKLGLAEIEEFDVGKGMEKHFAARWTLKTTYFWDQTFKAKAETVIEHHYTPSVGATVQTSIGSREAMREDWFDNYRAKYCIDASFLAAVENAQKAGKSEYGPPFSEQRISYILTTGGNWAGPIGSFRLIVDKADASSLVSFCGEGVKTVGATEFEVTQSNFTPKSNLNVLILKRLEMP
jgi:uncharacterized protein DUF4424